MTDLVTRLHAAKTTQEFVAICQQIVAASQDIWVNAEAPGVKMLSDQIATRSAVPWSIFLNEPDIEIDSTRRAFETTFNAALNGGYFKETENGVEQWAVNGSGSAALDDWIKMLRERRYMPYFQISKSEVRNSIGPLLKGLPHAELREEVIAEFADVERMGRFHKIFGPCLVNRVTKRAADGSEDLWSFNLTAADALADVYQTAFKTDPFRKKAILAFLMFAGGLQATGRKVLFDLPIPSDYQIPRILEWAGVIVVSNKIRDVLREPGLLDVNAFPVVEMRAAAVVACDLLRKSSGKAADIVDGTLFSTYRKNPDFLANSLPPMRCDSMWF